MPTLLLSNFNIVTAVLGGFVTLFGLVSYLLKENFYLSEALISLLAGVVFSPHAANFLKPLEFALGSQENLAVITLYFSRLVLGIQLVLAGVQLPSRYMLTEWKPLSLLLGPGMCVMWISASLLVWGMVPHLSFVHSLAIGACVTPTDPVLSNSIVKGRFADANIPKPLQKIIIAESGTNDGLGYPFLYLALYLVKYTEAGGAGQPGGASKAMGYWFGETWGYVILLSVAYGITVGWIARRLLRWAEQRKYVDRESFLVFAITMALFITGTCGMIGSDDVLACFVAGNAFTWDDWFRLETQDDSLQPTIDMLLNISVFMWYGAICPWLSFRVNDVIPVWRLILLGILILLFRRIPYIMSIHKKIPQIEEMHQAAFMGFFGPIGVSAIFYLYVSLDFLNAVTDHGRIRPDAERLKDVMHVVVWFLAICSIVVHGLSVPVGKLGYHMPRHVSRALSTSHEVDEPYQQSRLRRFAQNPSQLLRQRRNPNQRPDNSTFSLGPPRARKQSNVHGTDTPQDEPDRPINYPETPIDGSRTPNDALSRSQSPPARENGDKRQNGEALPNEAPRVPSPVAQKLPKGVMCSAHTHRQK